MELKRRKMGEQQQRRGDEKRAKNKSFWTPRRLSQCRGSRPRCPSVVAILQQCRDATPTVSRFYSYSVARPKLAQEKKLSQCQKRNAAMLLRQVGPYNVNLVRKHAKNPKIGLKLLQCIKGTLGKRRRRKEGQERKFGSIEKHQINFHHLSASTVCLIQLACLLNL